MNWAYLLEAFYSIIGGLFILSAYYVFTDKSNATRVGGAIFWLLLGLVFILAKSLPTVVLGSMIVILGLLSGAKQVNMSHFESVTKAFSEEAKVQVGKKVFLPPVILALSAFAFAQILPKILPAEQAGLGGQLAIGLAAISGLLFVIALVRPKLTDGFADTSRLIQSMGPSTILPQLLATLGAVFTAAGIGQLLSGMLSGVIPENNRLIGVVMYCLGMAIFTMIMGNGFAAFAVITAGVGIPFVIANGANPAIAGALALTSGYCGTLMTPMAANFNIVPANLLQTKSSYRIIRYQVPLALVLLVFQMGLMYFWAFN